MRKQATLVPENFVFPVTRPETIVKWHVKIKAPDAKVITLTKDKETVYNLTFNGRTGELTGTPTENTLKIRYVGFDEAGNRYKSDRQETSFIDEKPDEPLKVEFRDVIDPPPPPKATSSQQGWRMENGELVYWRIDESTNTYVAPPEVNDTQPLFSLFTTLVAQASLMYLSTLAGVAFNMATARALAEFKRSKRNAEIELKEYRYEDIKQDLLADFNANHLMDGESARPSGSRMILNDRSFDIARTHQEDNHDVILVPGGLSLNWTSGGGSINATHFFQDADENTVTYRYYFKELEGSRDANHWHEVYGMWIEGKYFNFNAADEFEHPVYYPFTVNVRAYGPYGRFLGDTDFHFDSDLALEKTTKWTGIRNDPEDAWEGNRFRHDMEHEMDISDTQQEAIIRYYSVAFYTNPFGSLQRVNHINEGQHEALVPSNNEGWRHNPESLYQAKVQFDQFKAWVTHMSANPNIPDGIFEPKYDMMNQGRPLFDGLIALPHQDAPRMLGTASVNGLTFDYDTGILTGTATVPMLVVVRMWDLNDVAIFQREALNGPAALKHDAQHATDWILAYEGDTLPEIAHFSYNPEIPDII